MKTIALKLNNKIFLEVEEITRALKVSRKRYINDAVSIYNDVQKRRLLKTQLEKESALTSRDSMEILHTFERQIDEIDSNFWLNLPIISFQLTVKSCILTHFFTVSY